MNGVGSTSRNWSCPTTIRSRKRLHTVGARSHGADLRQFISQLKKTGRAHKDDFIDSSALSHAADLGQFISQLKEIGRAHKHDFIVIDTPGGVQHLSLIAHGIADTLVTPINDSLSTSTYWSRSNEATSSPSRPYTPKRFGTRLRPDAKSAVARPTGSWFGTDWNQPRSSNQRQISQVLDVIRATLGFRIARGLLERPIYREFFAAGLTVLDLVEGFKALRRPMAYFTRAS